MPLFGLESYTTISRPSFYLQADLSEVISEGLAIEQRIEDISEALVQVGHLSEATRVMAVALNSGERVSPYALENFVILRDNVYKNLGRDVERYPSYLTIAEEGVSYRSALRLSLEEEKEVKKGIWQRIKEFFSKLWETLTNFFKKLFGLQAETEKKIEESAKEVKKDKEELKETPSEEKPEKVKKLLKKYNNILLVYKIEEIEKVNKKFNLELKAEGTIFQRLTNIDYDTVKDDITNSVYKEDGVYIFLLIRLNRESIDKKDENEKEKISQRLMENFLLYFGMSKGLLKQEKLKKSEKRIKEMNDVITETISVVETLKEESKDTETKESPDKPPELTGANYTRKKGFRDNEKLPLGSDYDGYNGTDDLIKQLTERLTDLDLTLVDREEAARLIVKKAQEDIERETKYLNDAWRYNQLLVKWDKEKEQAAEKDNFTNGGKHIKNRINKEHNLEEDKEAPIAEKHF